MPPFEWSDDYSVGIPEMDTQHRKLMELLAEVSGGTMEPPGRTLGEWLEEAQQYGQWHMRREELVLRVRGYPELEAHKAEHNVYRGKLAALQAMSDRRDFSIRLTNFLNEWWRYHILISDQQYARYFRKKGGPP